MIAVLTGDIINSRGKNTENWLVELKAKLSIYGKTPKDWEIFRGDSFQLLVPKELALESALHIKSAIKQFEDLDVRIGIGVGEIDYESSKITESNGSAFVHSGESFDGLKKQNMLLKSGNVEIDEAINLMLALLLLTANRWTSTVSSLIKLAIEHPDWTQNDLAKYSHKSQGNISETLKRGGFEEIMKVNAYYKSQIHKVC